MLNLVWRVVAKKVKNTRLQIMPKPRKASGRRTPESAMTPISLVWLKVTADAIQVIGSVQRQNNSVILARDCQTVAVGIPTRATEMFAVTTVNRAFAVGHARSELTQR